MAAHTGAGRAAILDASYRTVARSGYAAATTSRICAAAGVGSGTFFHFFPTKISVVVAILEQGAADAEARAVDLAERAASDPRKALQLWVASLVDDASDGDFAGFVTAVGALAHESAVATALAHEAAIGRDTVATIVEAGRQHGPWPHAGDDAATWVSALGDGYLARAAEDPSFPSREQADALLAACEKLLS